MVEKSGEGSDDELAEQSTAVAQPTCTAPKKVLNYVTVFKF